MGRPGFGNFRCVCVCVGGASCPSRRPVPILSPCHCWQAVPAPERTPVPQSRVSPLCTTGLELFCLGSTFLSRPSLPWTEHPGPSRCPPLPAALPPHDLSFPRVSCETRGPPPNADLFRAPPPLANERASPNSIFQECPLHVPQRPGGLDWEMEGRRGHPEGLVSGPRVLLSPEFCPSVSPGRWGQSGAGDDGASQGGGRERDMPKA